MRALWFEKKGSLEALRLRADVACPSPRQGEALVRVRAAGVNPSDPKNVLGAFPATTLPRIPGRDFSGVVEEGPREWIGTRVFASGGGLGFSRDGSHAEWISVPVEMLVPLPESLSFEQAGALGLPFVTAAAMVQAAAIVAGDVVLVLGASGAVGTAAAQIARQHGARVLGTRRSRPPAAAAPVDEWIDLSADADLGRAALDRTGGRGPDVVLDVVGGPLFEAAIRCLAQRGRYVVVASTPPRASLDLVEFYHREARLVGVDSLRLSGAESAVALRSLAPAFESGALRALPTESVPLERAREAYEAALLDAAPAKLVLVP